jgi:glycosyltransferase involved in cell wall biosynthesis
MDSATLEIDQRRVSKETPKLLVVTPGFGASGQPWLWRQVTGFQGFEKHLLCWVRWNSQEYPDRDVTVSVLPYDPAPYNGPGRWWLRLRNLPGANFYASVGVEGRRLDEFVRQQQPSVILCYFGDIAMRLLPVTRRYRIPLIAYFHGDFQFLDNRWYRWSLKRCLPHFAAIPVVTEDERRWMLQQGVPESKVSIIPCGVPTDQFHPVSQRPSGPVRFVMVSRLSPEKGCKFSIEAFAKMAPRVPDAELHIYGDGPERESLKRLSESLGLATRILFHGYVGEQMLAEVFPSYDVFIQHSIQKEGSPVSIAEAMACGLSVVATPVGGIVAQVLDGKTGRLVAERDVSGMAEAMLTLAQNPELRQRLGQEGRKRALNLYDCVQMTRRLEAVLSESLRV